MSIAKTKEAINNLGDRDLVKVNPSIQGFDDEQTLEYDSELGITDLKALAASHTRLLEAAERVTETYHCDSFEFAGNGPLNDLIDAIEEAEKNNDGPVWMCKVCGAEPDNEGWVRHGKGCYQLSEDGGGEEYIEEAEK